MPAVKADHLTKQYRVYLKPLDRLKEAVRRRPFHETVEALSDVSFQVPTGGTLGVIGENGAGKSTLLKILAGTVRPTQGDIVRQGRVAALLELGSGFHPEFSGRQNIYLNAALLGLDEDEIEEREEAIIDFSELRDVIERPVKTYSSGMYVRLGFSIATSVDPDILIIDEALSVGDQRFQQKCVERMMGFRQAKKTLVVCSHSMYLVRELCKNTIWLHKGHACRSGKTSRVIAEYLAYLEGAGGDGDSMVRGDARGSRAPEVIIEEVCVLDEKKRPLHHIKQFDTVVIQVKTRRSGPPFKGHMAIGIGQADTEPLFETTTKISGVKPIEFVGEQITELLIPSIPIGGNYRAKVRVGDEYAIRKIYEMRSKPFLIESDRPEIGTVWMEHHWRRPEAARFW